MRTDVIDPVQQEFASTIHNYLEVALLTTSLYDYLLCFGDEVHLMWRQPFKISTAIYFPVRYFPVAKIIFVIIDSILTPHDCTPVYRFVEFLGVISRAGILATLCARTYALCNRMKISVLFLCIVSTIAIIFGLIEVFETVCSPLDPHTLTGSAKWGLIVSITRLVAEGLGIMITLYKGRSDFKHHFLSAQLFTNSSLSSFILRSGILYFIATFTFELLSIVFNFDVLGPSLQWFSGVTNALPLPIPAILVSRFLLKLRYLSVHGTNATFSPEGISFSFVRRIQTQLDDFGNETTLYEEVNSNSYSEQFEMEKRTSDPDA